MRNPRSKRDRQGGATTVEFALVLPLVLAVLFGTIDYGWYFYQKFTLAAAIQGGVRAAIAVKETDAVKPWETARTAAKAILAARGAIAPTSVVIGPTSGSPYSGVKPNRALTMDGTFIFTPLVGFVPLPSKTMKFTATMLLDAQNADI
jgi:Flp pilus assembly protein TadG